MAMVPAHSHQKINKAAENCIYYEVVPRLSKVITPQLSCLVSGGEYQHFVTGVFPIKVVGWVSKGIPYFKVRLIQERNVARGPGVIILGVLLTRTIENQNNSEIQNASETTWYNSIIARIIIYVFFLLSIYFVMRLLYHRQNLKYSWKLEKMEKQTLKEINDAKIRFFTDISHDLKTPLTLIQGPIGKLYKSNSFSEEDVKKLLPVIYRNSQRLTVLIEELLTFRKLNAAQQSLNATYMDVLDLVKNTLSYYENIGNEKQLQIIKDFQHQRIDAWIDPFKMEQIMHNLLSNSFKYVHENGGLRLFVGITSGNPYKKGLGRGMKWVRITIFNETDYIDPEVIEKMFDRFYKINGESSGTGIGLSVAKSLVELHHGTINATYSKEMGGVEIEFFIPKEDVFLSQEEKNTDSHYIPMGRPLENVTNENSGHDKLHQVEKPKSVHDILIIEDNIDLQEFLAYSLASTYNVKVANNGESGIELAEKHIPDIIVSDVIMPKKDGFEVVQHVKNNIKTSHIPVILLTAKTTDEDQITGYHAGADAYVVKPFNIEVLNAQIERLIMNREIMQKNYKEWINEEGRPNHMSDEEHAFMSLINRQIDANINKGDINVNELAELVGLSTTQIYRKVKALTSYTPVEYIKVYKLKKAQKLLPNHKYSIKQIAYMSGFNDPSYFGKCFKGEYGLSPQVYRARHVKYAVSNNEISKN